jgi:hypothetical protein
MCDPSSPSLKVVNTTESRICGIPKTVKPHSLSSAITPPTSAAVSLPPQQQTTITKPTTAAAAASADSAPPPKQQQQQIATTNNNNASSLPTGGATRTTIAPVSNPSNKSLSSSSSSSLSQSPSAIAPQIKAVNQQHKQHQLAPPITLINGTKRGTNSTAGQNYTFTASSPAATSDKPLYLGYHDTTTTTTSSAHGNSVSKHKVPIVNTILIVAREVQVMIIVQKVKILLNDSVFLTLKSLHQTLVLQQQRKRPQRILNHSLHFLPSESHFQVMILPKRRRR